MIRVDDEVFDDGGEAAEHVIDQNRGIRRNDPLDRGMADVALMPERDIFQRGDAVRPHQTGQAGEVLRRDGVPLVGHGGGPLLALGKKFLGFQNLGPLKMPEFHGKFFDRGGDEGQGCKEFGMVVPLDDLG